MRVEIDEVLLENIWRLVEEAKEPTALVAGLRTLAEELAEDLPCVEHRFDPERSVVGNSMVQWADRERGVGLIAFCGRCDVTAEVIVPVAAFAWSRTTELVAPEEKLHEHRISPTGLRLEGIERSSEVGRFVASTKATVSVSCSCGARGHVDVWESGHSAITWD